MIPEISDKDLNIKSIAGKALADEKLLSELLDGSGSPRTRKQAEQFLNKWGKEQTE